MVKYYDANELSIYFAYLILSPDTAGQDASIGQEVS
jgi:hypothetical protein